MNVVDRAGAAVADGLVDMMAVAVDGQGADVEDFARVHQDHAAAVTAVIDSVEVGPKRRRIDTRAVDRDVLVDDHLAAADVHIAAGDADSEVVIRAGIRRVSRRLERAERADEMARGIKQPHAGGQIEGRAVAEVNELDAVEGIRSLVAVGDRIVVLHRDAAVRIDRHQECGERAVVIGRVLGAWR